ncbi:glycosyltransferase family 2 protein [Actinoplanes sp. CA-030573]|uniref:glycosyltransferase family 2 protein n=1 Tax=Actinoplanes sp. CA-030573 TaxID=3239898 RepID=UPI003D8AEE16
MSVSVVIPTVGRASLAPLLDRLRAGALSGGAVGSGAVGGGAVGGGAVGGGGLGGDVEVLVVDDRRDRRVPLAVPAWVTVLEGRGLGPAAARNTGWRAARHDWVAFLDDDVLPDPGWLDALAADLAAAPDDCGGVQGTLRVPLPADRRPTDWERVTAGLAAGVWITADMAYRRAALARCGGFDERLPRAFREDAELAFRVRRAGWSLHRGHRSVTHPVRPEGPWVSVRTQRGNADDALLRHLYGPEWRDHLGVPPGRRRRHAAITAAAVTAATCTLAALLTGRRSTLDPASAHPTPFTGWGDSTARVRQLRRAVHRRRADSVVRRGAWIAGALAGAVWTAGTAEFAAARIAPGPRDPREVAVMLATSVAIPPVAVAHWLRGWWRWRGAVPVAPAPFRAEALR